MSLQTNPFVLHVNWKCPNENAVQKIIKSLKVFSECQKDESGVLSYAFWRREGLELEFFECYSGI